MWRQLLTVLALLLSSQAEETAPGINRYVSEGVKSQGFKIMYGDEDLTILNEVVDGMEDNVLKKRNYLHESIQPLPAEDVKCLMSVNRYCSKEMGQMKSVLIQALKEDCSKCSTKQKEEAGKVIAAMMAYDPVAWKLFLTRYDGLKKVQRILG